MWGCLVGSSLSSSVYAELSLEKTHGVVCSILHFARCRASWELELLSTLISASGSYLG
jgi:hypothetical protein